MWLKDLGEARWPGRSFCSQRTPAALGAAVDLTTCVTAHTTQVSLRNETTAHHKL